MFAWSIPAVGKDVPQPMEAVAVTPFNPASTRRHLMVYSTSRQDNPT